MQGKKLKRLEGYRSYGEDSLRNLTLCLLFHGRRKLRSFFCEGYLEQFRESVHFMLHVLSYFKIGMEGRNIFMLLKRETYTVEFQLLEHLWDQEN